MFALSYRWWDIHGGQATSSRKLLKPPTFSTRNSWEKWITMILTNTFAWPLLGGNEVITRCPGGLIVLSFSCILLLIWLVWIVLGMRAPKLVDLENMVLGWLGICLSVQKVFKSIYILQVLVVFLFFSLLSFYIGDQSLS